MDIFSLVERIKPLISRTEEEASILALTLVALYATVLAEISIVAKEMKR